MRTLLFLAILAVVLFLFNPGQDDFYEFIESKSSTYFQNEIGESKLGDLLAQWGGDVTRFLAAQATERQNYLLFSTYTIDLDGSEKDENDWRFVGVAGQFFEWDRPEGLEEE